MRRSTTFLWLVSLAAVIVAACSEQPTQPPVSESGVALTAADSAAVLAEIEIEGLRPGGFPKFGGELTDTLVFSSSVDSFQVELVDRECAAASNEVSVVSPDSSLLSEWMCQEGAPGLPGQTCWPPGGGCSPSADPADTSSVWSFTSGYDADEGVVIDFETGVSGATGEMQVTGSFPEWTVSFEDGFDSDFNDFVLEVRAYGDTTVSLGLPDTTVTLHPWIDLANMRTPDSTFTQGWVEGDSTEVAVLFTSGMIPVDSVSVRLTAELLPEGGGHAHREDRLLFGELPTFGLPGITPAQHIGGHLKDGATRSDTITVTTDSLGKASFKLVAGFLGGRAEVIAMGVLAGDTIFDTLKVSVRVPSLIDLKTQAGSLKDSVYFGEGTTEHPADSVWYGTTDLANRLRGMAAMVSPLDDGRRIRVNQASLPWGGSFTITSELLEVSTDNWVDRPQHSHHTHSNGYDADLSKWLCSSASSCTVQIPDAVDIIEAGNTNGLVVLAYESGSFHVRVRSTVTASPGGN